MFKSILSKFCGKEIEHTIEEPIPKKIYTEFEKTILYKITKIFNIDEEYIKRYLRDEYFLVVLVVLKNIYLEILECLYIKQLK